MGLATVIIKTGGTIEPTGRVVNVKLNYEDGWHNWRDFFYVNVLPNKPDDMPLASHVRRTVTACLFSEYDKGR
jgi:hypothetical protein